MGILDEVEKIDEKLTVEERLEIIEENQKKILETLEKVLDEVRALRAEAKSPGRDRLSV